jgi:hypothetical protein
MMNKSPGSTQEQPKGIFDAIGGIGGIAVIGAVIIAAVILMKK